MTGILGQLKWESLKKKRKYNHSPILSRVVMSSGRSKVMQTVALRELQAMSNETKIKQARQVS